ncbi:MAG: hypothetical protein ACKO2G_01330 [Verrucomicrobiales bacterium]
MEHLKKLLADKRVRIALAIGFVGFILAVIVAWKLGVTFAGLKQAWVDSREFLMAHPWAMFVALVFLPGLPIPMSALLLIAGAVWGANVKACLLMLLAMALNMSWTYWLAAGPARGFIEKVLVNTKIRIPELPKNDHIRLILILRLTPGIPLFIHNYILGFFRTPFLLYLSLSLLLAGSIACGILVTGGAILQGKAGAAITGISLIVVGVLVIRILRAKLAKKQLTDTLPGLTEPPAPLKESPESAPDPASEI